MHLLRGPRGEPQCGKANALKRKGAHTEHTELEGGDMRASTLIGILIQHSYCDTVQFIYWDAFGERSFLGFDPGQSPTTLPIARLCLSVIAFLFGIIFGAFHRRWRERKSAIDGTAIRAVLRSPDLWRSFFAAPLVFSGVYAAAQTQPDFVVAFFFPFQTGPLNGGRPNRSSKH